MNPHKTAASALLAMAAALGLSGIAGAGTIDAVSSASNKLKVSGSTTTTTATVNFTFPYSGGTNRLYYDVIDHTAVSGFPKFAQTSTKTFSVSGLTQGTVYYYWLQIVDQGGGHPSANVRSSFKTDGTSAVVPRPVGESGGTGVSVDPLGRSNSSRMVRVGPGGAWIELGSGHR